MSARDTYPHLAKLVAYADTPHRIDGAKALDEIDRLRAELETCERRNESLQRWCDNNAPLVAHFRRKTGRR